MGASHLEVLTALPTQPDPHRIHFQIPSSPCIPYSTLSLHTPANPSSNWPTRLFFCGIPFPSSYLATDNSTNRAVLSSMDARLLEDLTALPTQPDHPSIKCKILVYGFLS